MTEAITAADTTTFAVSARTLSRAITWNVPVEAPAVNRPFASIVPPVTLHMTGTVSELLSLKTAVAEKATLCPEAICTESGVTRSPTTVRDVCVRFFPGVAEDGAAGAPFVEDWELGESRVGSLSEQAAESRHASAAARRRFARRRASLKM